MYEIEPFDIYEDALDELMDIKDIEDFCDIIEDDDIMTDCFDPF